MAVDAVCPPCHKYKRIVTLVECSLRRIGKTAFFIGILVDRQAVDQQLVAIRIG